MSLHCLSAKTASLLKSSQIITSVSTVVKELMENAIDAGANNIEVKLEYHGTGKIEVKDDGCGIKQEDTPYVCLPSYTSKIKEFSDLEDLHSYGFRGEALNAMCQLADVTVTTRTDSDNYALSYTMNARGEVVSQQPSHVPKGTTVTVSGLFRSLPVRREWMKNQQRAGEELRRAETVVKALAAVHPQLRATFTHNKCLVWQKSAAATLRQSLLQVVGHQLVGRLEEHCVQHAQFTAMMMLPKKNLATVAEVCQSSVDCMMLYINKRPVRHKKIEKLLVRHMAEFYPHFPASKYPTCFISMELPPAEVDVNLEPNKTRVFLNCEDVLLAKLDDFLNFHYEPKLPKPQATKDPPAASDKNQDNLPGNQVKRVVKRPKLDAALPAENGPVASQKTVRPAYKMLQEESNAALQRCKVERRGADTWEERQVVGESQQIWRDSDDPGVRPVTATIRQGAEHDREPPTSVCITAVPAGLSVKEVVGGLNRKSVEVLSCLDDISKGLDAKNEGAAGKSGDSVARHLNGFINKSSSSRKDTNAISETEVCVSQFFLNVDVPDNCVLYNGIGDIDKSELMEHENLHNIGKTVTLDQEEDGNDSIEEATFLGLDESDSVAEHPRASVTEEVVLEGLKDVMPEGLDEGLWNLVDSVSDSTVEGSSVVSRAAAMSESKEVQAQQVSGGPSADAPRETCPDNGRPGRDDPEPCQPISQSLWEAADCAADFPGRVVAAEQGSAGESGSVTKPASQSLWCDADSAQAEKWSRGNIVNKKGKVLQSGAVLARAGASLDETVQSASSQMGCKEQSAFTKFSRYMRPRILDENPGIAFTKVAGLLVNRWRALSPEEQARYEDLAVQVQQQRRCEQERRPVVLTKVKKPAKKEAPQTNTLDNVMQQRPQPTASARREYVNTETLPITLDVVRERFSFRSLVRKRGDGGSKDEAAQQELRLLGQLRPSGSWLYVRGRELGVLRHWALHERVLHYKLMAEHVVPTRPLDDKLTLTPSSLGSDLWELLLSLDRKFCSQARCTLVSCPAVDRNGFKIEVRESGDQVLCVLSSVASVTRFYGLADLRETLQLVQFHGPELAELRHCRPLKIANYLRCEAVRMAQQSPATMERDGLLELLRFWNFHMSCEKPTCLHHKPIYSPLHILASTHVDAACSS